MQTQFLHLAKKHATTTPKIIITDIPPCDIYIPVGLSYNKGGTFILKV